MSGGRPLALVTGGCRRIGAAIAGALARDGWDLALHSHSRGAIDEALRQTIAEAGATCYRFYADFADHAAVAALLPGVEREAGRAPALLVNNASHFAEDRPETVTHEALVALYAINCAAPVLLARDCAARGGAVIVNILDQRIASPHGDQFAYTLAKLALAGATEILARELAPATRVCGVAPGLTLPTDDYAAGAMARMAARMPLGRLSDPAAIAEAVRYLARADAVTGQIVYVDGGAHLRHWDRDFVYLED
ncbi:SDR family oxidoreductase [Sphingomonas sp.]|uniref:SDR family oxidoreductase n=1 Tax=Sphingomonas sp. TaxID=28214 RepID=UPI003AFF87AB